MRVIVLLACIGACSQPSASPDAPQQTDAPMHTADAPASAACPASATSDPVAAIAAGGVLDGRPAVVADPFVLLDGEGYHLFYSDFFCQTSNGTWIYQYGAQGCVATITTIGYAFSSLADAGAPGTWQYRLTPVVMPGPAEWQSDKIETASMLRVGDTLVLAYSATGRVNGTVLENRFQIGAATFALSPGQTIKTAMLDTANTFTMDPTPFVPYDLATASDHNNTQEPSLVRVGDELWLYYVALGFALPDKGASAPGQSLTSIDLFLRRYDLARTLLGSQKVTPAGYTNIEQVVPGTSGYDLFATGAGSGEIHHAETITCAHSSDGLTWPSPHLLLQPGGAGTDDNWGLMAPTIAGNHMFYTAYGTASSCNTSVRFGFGASDGTCVYMNLGRATLD